MPRQKLPRPQVAVAPLFISQETAYPLLGITPRKFLEIVVPRCAGHVIRLGKTVLVPTAVVETRLREMADRDAGSGPLQTSDEALDDDQPTSVDDVLARIGKERTRP